MSELRLLALYAATLGPAASALLAWQYQASLDVLPLAGLCLALAVAIGIGELIEPAKAALASPGGFRVRATLLTLVVGVVLLALGFAATFPRPPLLARQALLLVALQGMFLAMPALGPGRVPALSLSLALVVLASFRGGLTAALAAASFTLSLPVFLVFDNFHRRLALLPQAIGELRSTAAREAVLLTLPALVTLLLFLLLVPPLPHAGLEAATLDSLADQGQLASAYAQLGAFSLIGAAAVFYASRMLRKRKKASAPKVEIVSAERGKDETLPERPPQARPSYVGSRGAVVRAYVRFLAAVPTRWLTRRPDQTAAEIERLIPSPGDELSRLTAHFSAARYGAGDPSEAAAAEAEALATRLVGWAQSARDSGKPASTRQSETTPSVPTT